MRIAIYHELPSGGAKRALFEVTRRLARAHSVDAYTLSSADSDFCDLRPVVARHIEFPFAPLGLFRSPFGRFNQWQRTRDLRRLDRLSRQIANEIDRQGYQVVYVNPSLYTQAPDVLNYLATPSVYQANEPLRLIHEPDISRPYLNGGWRSRLDAIDPALRLYRRQLQAFDRRNTVRASELLANSQFTAANLKRIYGHSAAVGYIGIDLEAFCPPAQPARGNFVLSVGALRPNKGFDFLILALAQVPTQARPPLRLVTNADDPRERAYLMNQAQQAQVELTIETGIDHASLVQHYQQAALVVYAPVSEPLGFVPLEAAACGTPTVGVAEGGVCETIVNGVTGMLTMREPAAFAQAIMRLLGDPAERERLGRQAREWVAARWTWDNTVASVEGALARALAEKPGKSHLVTTHGT